MQNSFKLKNECNLILFWNQVCVQKHVFEHENHFLSLQFMRSKEKHHQTKNIEVTNMEILLEIVHTYFCATSSKEKFGTITRIPNI